MPGDMIALRSFGGEVPVLPAGLLPENGAQYAENCDFVHGHLQPMNQGFLLTSLSALVRSIYTEDGINFYTWPSDTYPVRSTVANDTYERIYYLDNNVLKVTSRTGMTPAGGQPTLSYKVGVPAPTVAPTLSTVELTEYPEYPNASFTCTAWWYDGTTYAEYQSGTVALTEVSRLRKYAFTMPAQASGTPSTSTVSVSLVVNDAAGNQFMTVSIDAGTQAESTAIPGNAYFDLTTDGNGVWTIAITYGIEETRAYTYTTNNIWLEESSPSPANTIDTTYVENVVVGLTAVDFTGYQTLAGYQVYRTMGANANYLLVHAVSTALSFTDTSHLAADILGALETLYYEAPPAALTAMIATDTGSLIGFFGNTLYISEVYRPHTWQYQLTFVYDIRGICAAPGSLVVTTADGCFIVTGSSPANLQQTRLPVPQSGIAQRSIANLDGVTAFASQDGLVSVTGSQASLVGSDKLFAREDWQRIFGPILSDASMRFGWYAGRLVATSYSEALGFMLVLDGEATGSFSRFNVRMDSMFFLPVGDTLYYSVGGDVYQFRGSDTPYSFTWWSRDYLFTRDLNLGWGFIRCAGPVTLTFYMDGAVWFTTTVQATGYFRLPPGRMGRRWSVKLQGTSVVEELYAACSMAEIKQVMSNG